MLRDTDLHPETRRKLGLPEPQERKKRTPKDRAFTREDLRREALRVLAQIRHLSTAERRRVLDFAKKLNAI